MFPRLHVNDTEKGGPRAPPRNKMALYEQLSIPSQRFISASASTSPISRGIGGRLSPSVSSSYAGAHQRNMVNPFCNSRSLSHSTEELHSCSLCRIKLNTMVASPEANSMKPSSYRSLDATGLLPSTSRCESFQWSNIKNSLKKLGDRDSTIPSARQAIAPHCGSKDMENPPCLSSSVKLQKFSGKKINSDGTLDRKSREFFGTQTGEDSKVSPGNQGHMERSVSIKSTRNNLVETFSIPSTRVKNSESLKRIHASADGKDRRSSVDNLKRLQGTNAESQKAYVAMKGRTSIRADMVVPRIGVPKENASKMRSESCSRPAVRDNYRSLNGFTNGSKCRENRRCVPLEVIERHDKVSDTCMLESVLGVVISPDNVVEAIGEKLFWKARSAIVNQQRMFAVQVFELHRLIKVQKMIAGSPDLLLVDNLYLAKHPSKLSPVKKLPSEYVPESTTPPKPNDDSMKSNPSKGYADESAVEKFPVPFVNNDTSTQPSTDGFYSANLPFAPVTTSTKLGPCSVHPPPGNQWLVPAMSPSEGLIYKPYTGSSLPTAGFMLPGYGNCGPISLNPRTGDCLNTVCGVPASHQGSGILPGPPPLGHAYYSLYGLPVMNQSLSVSGAEQTIAFAGVQPNGQDNQLKAGDINLTISQQSSCNMSGGVTRVISHDATKFPALKEGELQGSAASSSSNKAKEDTLSLFPSKPAVRASDQPMQTTKHRTQVIKVTPHNPRSATASAFRIFRSIQEERRQS